MTGQTLVSALAILAFGAIGVACKAGGVGDPCIPNEEFSPLYQGATETGAQIEDRSFQCETRVCLIKHFRGRVSCPFGNLEGRAGRNIAVNLDPECTVPGTTEVVSVGVQPQCLERKDQVYCSCRCGGTDSAAKYCECPSGYKCEEVTKSLDETLVRPGDKYCVKDADNWRDSQACGQSCDQVDCGFTSNTPEL